MDSVVGTLFALVTIGVGGLLLARADSIAAFMTGVFFGDGVDAQKTNVLAWALRVIAAIIVASAIIVLLFSALGLFGPG